MPKPADSYVSVTLDGGVVTARFIATAVEENAADAMLTSTHEAMDRAGGGLTDVILDFGGVEFINSSGLGSCFELRSDVASRGAQIILYRPSETVLQLFMVVNMESLFTIVHTDEELRSVVGPGAADA